MLQLQESGAWQSLEMSFLWMGGYIYLQAIAPSGAEMPPTPTPPPPMAGAPSGSAVAAAIGAGVWLQGGASLERGSSRQPEEHQRYRVLQASAIGLGLGEASRTLKVDRSDDNLTSAAAQLELLNWLSCDAGRLAMVLKTGSDAPESPRRAAAMHLVAWCLHGDLHTLVPFSTGRSLSRRRLWPLRFRIEGRVRRN